MFYVSQNEEVDVSLLGATTALEVRLVGDRTWFVTQPARLKYQILQLNFESAKRSLNGYRQVLLLW